MKKSYLSSLKLPKLQLTSNWFQGILGVNKFPRMAYFGGVFSSGEVNLRAVDYIPEYSYLVRATIDVFGH
jgi:hypothetical protein